MTVSLTSPTTSSSLPPLCYSTTARANACILYSSCSNELQIVNTSDGAHNERLRRDPFSKKEIFARAGTSGRARLADSRRTFSAKLKRTSSE